MSMQTAENKGEQGKGDQAKDAAGEVAGHASDQAGHVADSARSEAKSVAADAKDQASDVLHKTRSELRDQASTQTKALSSTLGELAGQLDNMADGSDDPNAEVARLAKAAAGQLQERADRLDERGFDGAVDDLKRFARNRPAAFVLGAVATGFAVGRLAKHADLKEAGEHAKDEASPDDSDDSGGSGGSKPAAASPGGARGATSAGPGAGGPARTSGTPR